MTGIIKIVKILEESGLLIKGVSETIKNEPKEPKGELLSIILGCIIAVSMLLSMFIV